MKTIYYLIKNYNAFKSLQLICLMFVICITNSMQAQITDSTKTAKDTTKTENLMDMQAKFLTSTFGENLDGNPTRKPLSFLELLDSVNLPPEQKSEYVNWYYLHANELTQKQKDSLGKAMKKKITEAKEKED